MTPSTFGPFDARAAVCRLHHDSGQRTAHRGNFLSITQILPQPGSIIPPGEKSALEAQLSFSMAESI